MNTAKIGPSSTTTTTKASRIVPLNQNTDSSSIQSIAENLFKQQSQLLKRIEDIDTEKQQLIHKLEVHRKQFGNYVDKDGSQKRPKFKKTPPGSPDINQQQVASIGQGTFCHIF